MHSEFSAAFISVSNSATIPCSGAETADHVRGWQVKSRCSLPPVELAEGRSLRAHLDNVVRYGIGVSPP